MGNQHTCILLGTLKISRAILKNNLEIKRKRKREKGANRAEKKNRIQIRKTEIEKKKPSEKD